MIGFGLSISSLALRQGGARPSPLAMNPAAFYDPADISTLRQDAAGTTPVTADGDPVGRMLDLSGNGRDLAQSGTTARPLFREAGGLRWLEFDGANDNLSGATDLPFSAQMSIGGGFEVSAFNTSYPKLFLVRGQASADANRQPYIHLYQTVPERINFAWGSGSVPLNLTDLSALGPVTFFTSVTPAQTYAEANGTSGSGAGVTLVDGNSGFLVGPGFTGKFFGAALFDRNLTNAERQALTGFYDARSGRV